MLKITNSKNNASIFLTRGDTAYIEVSITSDDGSEYEFQEGDKVIFRLKKSISDKDLLLYKEIDISTMILELKPEDTINLNFSKYLYEVELVTVNDEHFTVLGPGDFEIGKELENHGE